LRVSSYLALFLVSCSGVSADEANFAATAIIDDYVAVSKAQERRLEGATMEVDIEAEVPQLHKSGRLHALRRISALGRRITYDALRFEGDRSVKNEVIARYLTAESEALKSEPAAMAVTPVNYKFKYKGLLERDGGKVYAFHVSPRKKRVGLFVGELWLDPETHLRVRESGRMVKNPSVFLRKVEFVRDYAIESGVAIPARAQYSVDTRLVGKTNLSVAFTFVSLPVPGGDSQ
jgi:hypothetical protein